MFDDREDFCASAFMDKIFVLGGFCYNRNNDNFLTTSSCLEFISKNNNFKEISEMNLARRWAACVVFQGNIVVSGGISNNYHVLSSVESYDVFADKWTSLPNTINHHRLHSLVTIKDKLFVIDHRVNCCEIFDIVCKKFVSFKHPLYITFNKCVQIGNRIIAFQELTSTILCYDYDKDEWSEELCEVTKDLELFSCVKIPSY